MALTEADLLGRDPGPASKDVHYQASYTCTQFHKSDSFVRALIGPLGSGKSVACCAELMRLAHTQRPGPDGIKRGRGAIIRNTYRELADTTLRTWNDWFPPEAVGRWDQVNNTLHIIDKDIHVELLFRALDHLKDIKKLLSLELSWAWLNEAREIPKPVLDMLQGRVGRYPAVRDGGVTQPCILLDTNACDEDHWFYRVFEEEDNAGFSIFHQPSGLSRWAENLDNLPPGYYERLQPGHDQEWVNVYVGGQYGFVMDGKPVYPQYQDDIHVAELTLKYVPSEDLVVGLDFGLTPAACFLQRSRLGQWKAIDELVTEDTSTVEFAKMLSYKLQTDFRGCGESVEIWGDPAGDIRAETDKETPYDVLRAAGIEAHPVYTNDTVLRRESMIAQLTRLAMNGEAGFVISPKCRTLRKGMAGGFKYRRVQITGEERFHDKPDKNHYSHICEAAEYGLIGAGEGDRLITSNTASRKAKPKVRRAF